MLSNKNEKVNNMNYEKKYNEALERAKQFSEHPLLEDSGAIAEYIFPELADGYEDEKMMQFLWDLARGNGNGIYKFLSDTKKEDFFVWFKKQSEENKGNFLGTLQFTKKQWETFDFALRLLEA